MDGSGSLSTRWARRHRRVGGLLEDPLGRRHIVSGNLDAGAHLQHIEIGQRFQPPYAYILNLNHAYVPAIRREGRVLGEQGQRLGECLRD